MERYVGIFMLNVIIGVLLYLFVIPILFGFEGVEYLDLSLAVIVIIMGSFIITQLFYIINFLKKNHRNHIL